MINVLYKKIFFFLILFLVFVFFVFKIKVFFLSSGLFIEDFEDSDFLVTNNQIYFLKGKAPGTKEFYINGREIFLDKDYNFKEKIFLSENQNIFFIKTISKTNVLNEKKIIIFYLKDY